MLDRTYEAKFTQLTFEALSSCHEACFEVDIELQPLDGS